MKRVDSAEFVTITILEPSMETVLLKPTFFNVKMDTGSMLPMTNVSRLMFLATGTSLTLEDASTAQQTTIWLTDHVFPTNNALIENFSAMEIAFKFLLLALLS